MKVYFVYNGKDADGTQVREMASEFKVKLDTPSSWTHSPCEKLLNFFVKTYNAKNASFPLEADELEIFIGSMPVKNSDIIEISVREYNDITFVHKKKGGTAETHEGETLCTNFGCGQYFREEENTDTSCHCHVKPPVFHDLEKYWGCCADSKAVDWEAFQKIEACHICRHSTENKPFVIPKEEINNIPLTSAQVVAQDRTAPVYEERRTTGPREFEGATQEAAPQAVVDGKAKCRNFGCGQTFVVADNSDTTCKFHSAGPVFHDARKFWSCCPQKKCDDFDDLFKVEGCTYGPHKL